MFTDEDIKKLTNYQLEVFKDVFVTKEDFGVVGEIKTSLNTLQTSVDNMAKDIKDLKGEKTIMNYRMKNAEDWIDKASPKLGLEFKR